MVRRMYAQQYRQPPKDYGGTAMKPPKEEPADDAARPPEPDSVPLPERQPPGSRSDELLIAAVIMIVMSGDRDGNMLTLLALLFILL